MISSGKIHSRSVVSLWYFFNTKENTFKKHFHSKLDAKNNLITYFGISERKGRCRKRDSTFFRGGNLEKEMMLEKMYTIYLEYTFSFLIQFQSEIRTAII